MSVTAQGAVAVLNPTAGLTQVGSAPIDPDLVADRFLYVLEAGSGSIATFEIGAGAALSARPDTPAGSPASGLQGMAAW